jgi:hypothetical protein
MGRGPDHARLNPQGRKIVHAMPCRASVQSTVRSPRIGSAPHESIKQPSEKNVNAARSGAAVVSVVACEKGQAASGSSVASIDAGLAMIRRNSTAHASSTLRFLATCTRMARL